MAINSNHTTEDLNEVKCAIVEKNASPERVAFLKNLLEFNKFTVIVVPSPPPKVAAPVAPPVSTSEIIGETTPPEPIEPTSFTVGVTSQMFNPTNAIFGRLLKTPDGHIVTLAYWNQLDVVSHDEVPYFNMSTRG